MRGKERERERRDRGRDRDQSLANYHVFKFLKKIVMSQVERNQGREGRS